MPIILWITLRFYIDLSVLGIMNSEYFGFGMKLVENGLLVVFMMFFTTFFCNI